MKSTRLEGKHYQSESTVCSLLLKFDENILSESLG